MININPQTMAGLQKQGALPAASTAAASPLAAATPTTADIQQSLNNVVGYYQPQTPQEKAYADELAKYVGGLDAQYGSYGATRLTGDRLAQLPFGGPQLYKAPTAEQISSYYGMSPEEQTFYSFNLPSNKGNRTGNVDVRYNTPIALYDYRDGKLLYSGTGFEAAEKVAEMARNLSETQGRKAEWGIYTGQPGSTDPSTFKQVAYEKPNQSTLGKIADVALPAALAFVAPTFLAESAGALAAGAAAGGGAALGSGLSSALQGRSFEDALKRAAISGVTTFGVSQIPGFQVTPGGTVGGNLSKAFSSLAPQKAATIGNEIVVTTPFKSALASGIGGSAASTALANAGLEPVGPTEQGYQPNAVTKTPVPSSSTGGLNSPNWMDEALANQADTVVTAGWRPTTAGGGVGALSSSAAANAAAQNLQQAQTTNEPPAEEPAYQQEATDEEIRVVAKKAVDMGLADNINVAISSGIAQTMIDKFGPDIYSTDPAKQSAWDKIPSYLKYGALGITGLSALSKALAGKGGGSPTTPSVTSPIFTAKLPEPGAGFGGTGGGSFAARPVSTSGGTGAGGARTMEDWLTYGTRPERSFFSYVPENTAVIGKAMGGYAAGGPRKSFAVEGAGTGRSDDIPAVLSDGEYVIDAETVALLGDGSSKAGAKKLDEFRINVRKHKGQKLAKGKFSANAKRPEKYMGGGSI